jgi:diacylglycerol kinase (ATP)
VNNEIKKVFFIVNKYSGSGFKAGLENTFMRACKDHQTQSALEYTQHRGHATELAKQAIAAGYDKIVAVGGDGTVNEVAQGLLNTGAAMGIIPKGSGNGLARHLGISVKTPNALECLFTSKRITIDTFRINDKLSLNVSGIGFDGYIADLFGADKRRGFHGYTKLVLNEFRNFGEFDAQITIDGTRIKKQAFVIAIANSSQYGNNARIAPGASVCDEVLNMSILKKFPVYRLDFIYSFFSGTIDKSSYCDTIEIREATIELSKQMAFHVDGEAAGAADKFNIRVMPASLHMLAPCLGKI